MSETGPVIRSVSLKSTQFTDARLGLVRETSLADKSTITKEMTLFQTCKSLQADGPQRKILRWAETVVRFSPGHHNKTVGMLGPETVQSEGPT